MDRIAIDVTLIVLGILLNGFFAASEIALVSARVSRLERLRGALPGAGVAIQLKGSPETFLASIQIGITLVSTLASALGGATAVEALTPVLTRLGAGGLAEPLALGCAVVLLTYASLVAGELAPKALALRDPERLAARVARPILALGRVSGGLVRLLTASTNGLLRLANVGGRRESPFTSEDDVRYLVREGAAKGIFERTEEELVHNVFEFTDTTARQVMVPRMQIKGLDVTTPPEEIPRAVAALGHSRVPVYRRDIADPVGILVLKDLLRAVAERRPIALTELLHPPCFVPESSQISAVLRELQRRRQNLALVVDEYGSVVGLLTVEDLVEEIVGEIREEGERDTAPTITRLPDGALAIDGLAPVDEVQAAGIPVEESADYTTAAGFLIAALGTIPRPGDAIVRGGHRWRVLEMDGPRVRRIRVERA
jgi:putative hemolysin